MNFYFELAECVTDPRLGRYFVARDFEDKRALLDSTRYLVMIRESERVWAQDGDSVYYVKNRRDHVGISIVDEDEFLLVMLRSRTV
jgi:hypothetical protein